MEGLLQFIRSLGAGRLLLFGAVTIGAIFFFSSVLGQLNRAPLSILFTDLEPADANAIVQRLETQNVPYKLGPGGASISVPRDQIDSLRLSLAGEGLSGGVVGKELFDKERFGQTSKEIEINYVRAMEGELARTIRFIRGVREARVHLVMPDRRPFAATSTEASASVMLNTQGGGIGPRQAASIQSLVASAIPGLNSERVTITDTSGRLLSDGANGGENAAFSNLEEARIAKENYYRGKIEKLLEPIVGAGKVRAQVSVDMSMNRLTEKSTSFDPDNQVISESTEEEKSSTDTRGGGDGGDPSTANTVPGATDAGTGAGSGSSNSESKVTQRFLNSSVERVNITEPGQITDMRVSVVVDFKPSAPDANGLVTYSDWSPQEKSSMRELVEKALPLVANDSISTAADGSRVNDDVTFQSMQFAAPPPMEAAEPEFEILGFSGDGIIQIIQPTLMGLLGILFLLMVVRPVLNRVLAAIPAAGPQSQAAITNQGGGGMTPALAGPGGLNADDLVAAAMAGDEEAAAKLAEARSSGQLTDENMKIATKIDVAQVEGRVQESAVSKVSEIVRGHPDETVSIIRSWLYTD